MSLTDDWKAGKLEALKLYYVLYKNGHIGKANLIQTPDYYGFWNNCDLTDLIKEVLAVVPEYPEFVHLETTVAQQTEHIKELEQKLEIAIETLESAFGGFKTIQHMRDK